MFSRRPPSHGSRAAEDGYSPGRWIRVCAPSCSSQLVEFMRGISDGQFHHWLYPNECQNAQVRIGRTHSECLNSIVRERIMV